MRSEDLGGLEWISTDALEEELQELIEEEHRRVIWRRLDIAAITVALVLVALSVYVIVWGS